jgi:hypothetical protein
MAVIARFIDTIKPAAEKLLTELQRGMSSDGQGNTSG